MKVLFLAHLFPIPADSGGKIKSLQAIKALASRHEVRVLAFTRNDEEAARVPELLKLCAGVDTIPLVRGKLRQGIDLARALVTGRSFIVTRDFRIEMREAFARLAAEFAPEVVHIDHLQMAQFVDFTAPYRTILDNHNVESTIIRRVSETSRSAAMRFYARIEWPKLRDFELDACRRSNAVLTVSDEDARAIRKLDPSIDNVRTVPIGVDTNEIAPVKRTPGSKNILSIATMHWPPNIDSMLYFHREVYPLVQGAVGGCTLTIAGQKPPASIRALESDPSVRVTGYIAETRDVARDCGAFIVPLRSGSGVRVKILNALAMALPVVSTTIGVEGIEVESGSHLIIADSPRDFADAVIRVLHDEELASCLGAGGRELVTAKYSAEIVGRRLLDLYEATAVGAGR